MRVSELPEASFVAGDHSYQPGLRQGVAAATPYPGLLVRQSCCFALIKTQMPMRNHATEDHSYQPVESGRCGSNSLPGLLVRQSCCFALIKTQMLMRTQPAFQLLPIERIVLPVRSRDELPPILAGLHWIWCHPALRNEVFQLLDHAILGERPHSMNFSRRSCT